MCRFVAYRGDPLPIADLVFRPSNGLVHQAADAMESPTRINADGFGVGWYNLALHPEPAVFKDVAPAWNDRNLRSLADKVASDCILAHVRAARRNDTVSRANCHPFQHGSLLWMHNGDVPGRGRLHRRITSKADENLVALIGGSSDTELLFVLFLSFLEPPFDRWFTVDELRNAMHSTIERIERWWREDKDARFLGLNLCVTDGRVLVASRFSRGGDSLSLHYCIGSRFACSDGQCRIETDGRTGPCVLIASEELSKDDAWRIVEPDHLIVVPGDMEIAFERLSIP